MNQEEFDDLNEGDEVTILDDLEVGHACGIYFATEMLRYRGKTYVVTELLGDTIGISATRYYVFNKKMLKSKKSTLEIIMGRVEKE